MNDLENFGFYLIQLSQNKSENKLSNIGEKLCWTVACSVTNFNSMMNECNEHAYIEHKEYLLEKLEPIKQDIDMLYSMLKED